MIYTERVLLNHLHIWNWSYWKFFIIKRRCELVLEIPQFIFISFSSGCEYVAHVSKRKEYYFITKAVVNHTKLSHSEIYEIERKSIANQDLLKSSSIQCLHDIDIPQNRSRKPVWCECIECSLKFWFCRSTKINKHRNQQERSIAFDTKFLTYSGYS